MNRWALILIFAGAGLPAMAQQAPPAGQEPADEDGPGVARLSVMNGDVSVRRGDSGDLVAAAQNAPLVITDRVFTGAQSRAEIQFDWADMIRIGSNAEVRLSALEYRRYQIQIAVGTTTFRVRRQSNAAVEISTPSVAVHPLGIGVYRVTVREDGSSEITVRDGEAEIFTPTGSERLRAGTTMLARGSAQEPEFQQVAAIPYDEWDRWNQFRDQELERSHAYQYVTTDIPGAEDLDNHGRWVSAEGYGNVWAPTVDPGWAPYRYGRWTWEDYYGWTWVSYDPWGWAPYHYGRWFYAPVYGWCWWPGGIHEHYWRPALVAFFGWGGAGFGVGFGGWGHVGWVPLAPHEPFHPWYGRGFYGGHNSTTIVNNVNIASSYRNARVNNGITAVNRDVFGRGAIGNSNMIRVNGSQLQNAGLVHGALPLNPARESYRLADRSVSSSAVARGVENRTFFSRQSSAGTRGGWPTATPSYRGGSTASQDLGGWHRFGDPAPHATAAPNASGYSAGRATADTRRFGGSSGGSAPQSAPVQRNYTAPNSYNGRAYGGGSNYAAPPSSGSPVRINPPMVRERPSNSQPSFGGGNRGYSAPAAPQSAPHNSAPAAPRSSGGGGGGSSHGGGGGSHGRGR